jgi:hypothetical protein
VRVAVVPDWVTVVSLQVVSTDNEGIVGTIEESVEVRVITVVVPDCVIVVSLHVVSYEVGVTGIGIEEKVTTVMVPDCVMVLSLHVVSNENSELGPMEYAPVELMLFAVGDRKGCVTVRDDPVTTGPADAASLADGPSERTDERPFVLVDGIASDPGEDAGDAAELGIGNTTVLIGIADSDELSLLHGSSNVTAPVLIEVITVFVSVIR